MKDLLLRLLAISLRLCYHFVALCATQLLTFDFSLQAQAPQGIPYQAIARNASGVAIANTSVKVRFSIRDSIATGAIKYQETHNPTTSALGLFSVNVGMGTVVSGTFSGINWGKNAKFLQVEMDPAGGTTFTDLGTTQMLSVPYSLYSDNAGNGGFTNMQVFDNPGSFTWTAPQNIRKVKVECWGGGAGSVYLIYAQPSQQASCAGSAGGYGCGVFNVSPGTSYNVTVGMGGAAYYNLANVVTSVSLLSGSFGGTSSFDNLIQADGATYYFMSASAASVRGIPGSSNGPIRIIGGEPNSVQAGSAPLGGSGGNGASSLSGKSPGGGGFVSLGPQGTGGNGRIVIWY